MSNDARRKAKRSRKKKAKRPKKKPRRKSKKKRKRTKRSGFADPMAQLDPFSRALLAAKIEKPNITKRALAKRFMADEGEVGKRMNKDAFKAVLEQHTRDKATGAMKMLENLVPKAIRKLEERIESSMEHSTEVRAATATLDYAVGKKERHTMEEPMDITIEYVSDKPKRKAKKKSKH